MLETRPPGGLPRALVPRVLAPRPPFPPNKVPVPKLFPVVEALFVLPNSVPVWPVVDPPKIDPVEALFVVDPPKSGLVPVVVEAPNKLGFT